jgi:selenide,water dikinase
LNFFLDVQSLLSIICDPQTSGGLLIMVSDSAESEFHQVMQKSGFDLEAIGEIVENNNQPIVQINA